VRATAEAVVVRKPILERYLTQGVFRHALRERR